MSPEDFIDSFEYGNCDKISPLIRRIIANNPGPFTFTGTGTYIIGKENLAIIDPGPIDQNHFDAIIKSTKGQTITHILLTHNHNDHSPLAKKIKEETGAKIYFKNLSNDIQTEDQFEEGYDKDIEGDIELSDGDIIETNEWTVEAIHTPGHTSNHICYSLAEEDVLFSGDHVMGWSTTVIVPPDGDMNDYINSLKKLLKRSENNFYPTHGPIIERPKELVAKYIEHRMEREKQITEAIKLGNKKIPDMVKIIYKDVDISLHPAAAMSTLAHLIRMKENNEIAVSGNNLNGTYELVD
ncbi:MAG: MBL fold metallo-hydrolase [Alphaproteobacteria bacterium]|jgi:glyoxylase-like metal-dependent hydrolase (beta-lactamase superfamily II)|tara:strand:- start:2777 stop:3664 length:888 start_codon:yes stop_codon:yes gene_type:complete